MYLMRKLKIFQKIIFLTTFLTLTFFSSFSSASYSSGAILYNQEKYSEALKVWRKCDQEADCLFGIAKVFLKTKKNNFSEYLNKAAKLGSLRAFHQWAVFALLPRYERSEILFISP